MPAVQDAGSLWHTTAMDGGSAEIAGANFCPYTLYIKLPLLLTPLTYIHVGKKKPTFNGWLKRVLHYEKNSLLAFTTCTHITISISKLMSRFTAESHAKWR